MPVKCNLCSKVLATSEDLLSHGRMHVELTRTFYCQNCSYSSHRRDALQTHTKTHRGGQLFYCLYCPFVASNMTGFTRHKNTHDADPAKPKSTILQKPPEYYLAQDFAEHQRAGPGSEMNSPAKAGGPLIVKQEPGMMRDIYDFTDDEDIEIEAEDCSGNTGNDSGNSGNRSGNLGNCFGNPGNSSENPGSYAANIEDHPKNSENHLNNSENPENHQGNNLNNPENPENILPNHLHNLTAADNIENSLANTTEKNLRNTQIALLRPQTTENDSVVPANYFAGAQNYFPDPESENAVFIKMEYPDEISYEMEQQSLGEIPDDNSNSNSISQFRQEFLYSCNACNYRTTKLLEMNRHLNQAEDGGRLYTCDLCDLSFCSMQSVVEHRQDHEIEEKLEFNNNNNCCQQVNLNLNNSAQGKIGGALVSSKDYLINSTRNNFGIQNSLTNNFVQNSTINNFVQNSSINNFDQNSSLNSFGQNSLSNLFGTGKAAKNECEDQNSTRNKLVVKNTTFENLLANQRKAFNKNKNKTRGIFGAEATTSDEESGCSDFEGDEPTLDDADHDPDWRPGRSRRLMARLANRKIIDSKSTMNSLTEKKIIPKVENPGTSRTNGSISRMSSSSTRSSKTNSNINRQGSKTASSGKQILSDRKCFYCNKTFTCPSSLQLHIRIHTGEKPFECPKCSFSTSQRGNLRTHLKTHKGVLYFCTVCTYSGSSAQSVNLHIKNEHPGVDPVLRSSIKGEELSENSKSPGPPKLEPNLPDDVSNAALPVVKIESANGPDPNPDQPEIKLAPSQLNETVPVPGNAFQCASCKKISRSIETFRRHNCKKVRLYGCSHCNHSTKKLSHLKIHWKSHKAGVLVTCKVCDYKTSNLNALARHIKQSHREKKVLPERQQQQK